MRDSGRFSQYVKEVMKSQNIQKNTLPDPEPMLLAKKSYRDPKGCIANLRQ